MTEQELRRAIEQKEYTYKEEIEPSNRIAVVAIKGSEKKFVGMKELLLMTSLEKFMQNNVYLRL